MKDQGTVGEAKPPIESVKLRARARVSAVLLGQNRDRGGSRVSE
jgi:hypothetical protein